MAKIILIILCSAIGALIGYLGWLSPDCPEHVTFTSSIISGIISGMGSLGIMALVCKHAEEREQISRLMDECYCSGKTIPIHSNK